MITNAATELTGAQFGAFFYNVEDQEGESYTLYTLAGVPREMFSQFPMPRNTEVFSPTFRGEGVVRSDDITKDPRYGKNAPHRGMPKGHLPVCSYLAVPVVSRSGEVIGGLYFGHEKAGMFTENHERIVISLASQAAIAMDNAHLFKAVERARKEAQASASALAKSNAELEQVAYVAAHDLQEPLRTIASFTQLVERRFRSVAGGQADDLVDGIVGSVRRMQALLNDLLEYTSLSREEERPRGPVDMVLLIRECVAELGSVIHEKQARLLIDTLPVIAPGNGAQLKILLLNILTNALKYARPGVPPEVTIQCQRDDSSCTFSVRDNGQGFAPEYSKQIFGMFKRLHGRDVPGTGIGLALCRRIVEVHGGSIWAESEPGSGATIFFMLPCQPRPE
jgi:signal transduction histidine kinase